MLHCLLTVLLFLTPQDSDQDAAKAETPAPQLINARSGEEVGTSTVVADFAERDVLFLGEEHDSTPGHEMQLQLIQALHKLDLDLVISMEQFERDVQGVLNDYLAGRIDEEEFLANSRPWPNYKEHYRPIVEFAKEHNLDIIAGNVPRRIASDVAKGDTPAPADAAFVPRSTSAPEDAYWRNFQGVMGGHGGTGGHGGGDDNGQSMQRFYAAQCLKDDAMAEAITDYLAVHPHRQPLVVHLCGKFHSDGGLGTVSRLVDRAPLLQVGVLSMQTFSGDDKPEMSDLRNRAHYVLLMRKPEEKADAVAEASSGENK